MDATTQSTNSYINELFGKLKQPQSRRQRATDIAITNAQIVEDLLTEAKLLLSKNDKNEAERIVNIVEKILDNNKKYQDVVGELLSAAD